MSAWQKSVFGFGSAAFGIKDFGFNTFLLIFYNQVLGVPATLVSGAIAAALIIDAVADPFIGALSDNWRSRLGRRHPFMYASAVPVAVLYFFIWNPPAWSPGSLFFYLLAVSILLRIAVACYDNTVRLFDISGKAIQPAGQVDGHAKAVYAAAYSPDGKILATGSEDESARLWDTTTTPYKELSRIEGHTAGVRSVAFTTALISVTRSFPSSSSRMPSMVQPAGVVTASLSNAG